MPEASPGGVFVSYRREDSAYPAAWLYRQLAEHFGRDQIFKDIDSIDLGDDFVDAINTEVGSCQVLLALIGDQWLTIVDDDGGRRIDNANDFVRLEIEAALERNIRVIPILVGGAKMPRIDVLPPSLHGLVRRQALALSPERFDTDILRLVRVLEKAIQRAQTGSPAASSEAEAVDPSEQDPGPKAATAANAVVPTPPGSNPPRAARPQRVTPAHEGGTKAVAKIRAAAPLAARNRLIKKLEQLGYSTDPWSENIYYIDDYLHGHTRPRVVLRSSRIRIEAHNRMSKEWGLWKSFSFPGEIDEAVAEITKVRKRGIR